MNWRAKTSSSCHTIVKKPTKHYMHCLLHGYFYYRYFGIPQGPNIRLIHHPVTEQFYFFHRSTVHSECCHNIAFA